MAVLQKGTTKYPFVGQPVGKTILLASLAIHSLQLVATVNKTREQRTAVFAGYNSSFKKLFINKKEKIEIVSC